jgi:integrase
MAAWTERIRDTVYVVVTRPGQRRHRRKVAKATPEGMAEAEEIAAEIRRQQARDGALGLDGRPPMLADMAGRYLREDLARLAPTTRGDRPGYLRESGPILRAFGSHRMDEITPAMLRAWWGEEVEATVEVTRGSEVTTRPRRSLQTGRHYLNVLQAVYGYAIDLGLVESSPVPAFRQILRRHARTKQGRCAAESARHVRPLSLEACAALVWAARAESLQDLVLVLLCLDSGLRLGEALGLRWECVAFGTDANDRGRHLHLDGESNRPRGGAPSAPKSGRTRDVHLSRRLRTALLDLQESRLRPRPSRTVIVGVDPHNWRRRAWRRIWERAGIGRRNPKDLRDTFASQLLTAGVQLGYLSQQLGHADVAVTAEHYARWCGGSEYLPPVPLLPGEVPADLLARLSSTPATRQQGASNPTLSPVTGRRKSA